MAKFPRVWKVNLEAEYNNRAKVPEHPAIMAAWREAAEAYRSEHPPTRLAYGPGERESLDLFSVGDGPTAMFIHGGYWQALDGSWFSHMAKGLNAHGINVAVATYGLCPQVSLTAIIDQMRAAAGACGAGLVYGHSAGGHLAACLLATEPQVRSAYAISGLFDLPPLIGTSINGALGLDEAEARRLSPLFWTPPAGKALDAVVGADEGPEYDRQSRDIIERWGRAGVRTRFEAIEGANHFTVIAPLADAGSAMVARLRELATS